MTWLVDCGVDELRFALICIMVRFVFCLLLVVLVINAVILTHTIVLVQMFCVVFIYVELLL